MWMQKSVEGASITSGGNFHSRNRFQQHGGSGSYDNYGGGGGDLDGGQNGDWKNKILEGGQWLGGKVIEYGGKLARGAGSHDSIPDHISQQMPRNDGRANWMADIRSSSFTNAPNGSNGSGGYNNGGGGYSNSTTYQNDFAKERPKAYSDSYNSGAFGGSSRNDSNGFSNAPQPFSSSRSSHHHHHHRHKDDGERKDRRRVKKKSESSGSKHRKASKKYVSSGSESDASSARDSHSDASSADSASDSDRSAHGRRSKSGSKSKSKKHSSKSKSKSKKHGFYSDDDDASDSERDTKDRKKKGTKPQAAASSSSAANYSYSFDPSKLPPPPANDGSKKESKPSSSKHSKKSSKSRGRRQSMESSDSEVHPASDKENQKSKKRSGKSHSKSSKAAAAASSTATTVDLLGVGFDSVVAVQPQAAAIAQPSIFDAVPAPQSANPLQDLAGLNFPANAFQGSTMQPPSIFEQPGATSNASSEQEQAPAQFTTSLLPENNIVDLSSLASEKKKDKATMAAERRTLNDLQKAKGASSEHSTPVMPMHPQMHTGGGALVPAGGMMNPMAMNGMHPMHAGQMMNPQMMNPQMQAQWMQQQQQQYAMSGMMHASNPQATAAFGNFPQGGAAPNAGNFQFQQ